MKGTSSHKMVQMVSLIPVVLMVCALFASVEAESGILAFEKDYVLWVVDSAPMSLKINITDVTDLKGIVFSVEWDPAILNCTSYTPGTFLPAGMPDATGWMITWDKPAGQMQEAANQFMAGYGPISVSSPNWGWVMTLNFTYVGTTPIETPISTEISIVKNPSGEMETKWRDSGNVYHDFDFLGVDPIVHMISAEVIPEFPLAVVMLGLFIVVTLLAVVFKKKSGFRRHSIH
jgi:hypothetical protein